MSDTTSDFTPGIPAPRTRLSPQRILARDRRRAAVHEASHACVAQSLGYWAQAQIFPVEIVGDPLLTKTWGGNCRILGCKGADHSRMVAVAGAVGEALFHGSAKLSFERIREELEMTFEYEEDAMSPTDWKFAGETPGRPGPRLFKALNRTMTLLAERRAEVLWEARELIIFARDYPGAPNIRQCRE
jgi:hypothetical protein